MNKNLCENDRSKIYEDICTYEEGYLSEGLLLHIFWCFVFPVGDKHELKGDILFDENDSGASCGARKRAAVELQVS